MQFVPRHPSTASVAADIARAIILGAAEYGLDPAELAARFEIPPDVLADVDGRLPATLLVALWDEVPRLCNQPDFGLLLGEKAGLTTLTLAGHMLVASETLGVGLRRVLQYYRVFNDVHPTEVIEAGETVTIAMATRDTPMPVPRQAIEFVMAWLMVLARRATGVDVRPIRMRFEHRAPERTTEHARVFGCPLAFDAPSFEAVFPRRFLELPNRAPDQYLCAVLESHARALMERLPTHNAFSSRVRQVLCEALPKGEPTVDVVARALRLSARTVQRYLKDEGTSLQAVLDELRRDLAVRYLAGAEVSIAEVGFTLGFSDQSAFHRAFVRWTGQTPGAYRRAQHAGSRAP